MTPKSKEDLHVFKEKLRNSKKKDQLVEAQQTVGQFILHAEKFLACKALSPSEFALKTIIKKGKTPEKDFSDWMERLFDMAEKISILRGFLNGKSLSTVMSSNTPSYDLDEPMAEPSSSSESTQSGGSQLQSRVEGEEGKETKPEEKKPLDEQSEGEEKKDTRE